MRGGLVVLFLVSASVAEARPSVRGPAAKGLIAPQRNRPPSSPDVEIARNVRYGEDPYLNALDVFRPVAPGNHPVLVFIHGGGWSEGDKGNHPRKGTFFARQGFVWVSINYRLSPAVKHPVHVQDVARALGWVRRNIAQYGGDPSRIFLLGHSAGAHLAALVVADPRYLRDEAVPLDTIAAVALLDGSGYDLERRVPRARGWMRQMLVTAFGDNPSIWRDASPALQLARTNRIPPFLILHITIRKASKTQAQNLARAVSNAGGQVEVVPVRGRNHVTINKRLGLKNDPVARRILAFFRRAQGS